MSCDVVGTSGSREYVRRQYLRVLESVDDPVATLMFIRAGAIHEAYETGMEYPKDADHLRILWEQSLGVLFNKLGTRVCGAKRLRSYARKPGLFIGPLVTPCCAECAAAKPELGYLYSNDPDTAQRLCDDLTKYRGVADLLDLFRRGLGFTHILQRGFEDGGEFADLLAIVREDLAIRVRPGVAHAKMVWTKDARLELGKETDGVYVGPPSECLTGCGKSTGQPSDVFYRPSVAPGDAA